MNRTVVSLLLLATLGGMLGPASGAVFAPASAQAQQLEPDPAAPPVVLDPLEQEQQLRAALQLTPEDADLHARLAAALLEQGRPQEALAVYREAVRLAPGTVEYRRSLAEAALAVGEWQQAEAEFRAAIRLDPGEAALFSGLGEALRMQERRDEALTAYREALRRDPANVRLRQLLTDLEATRSRGRDGGISLLQRALTVLAAVPLTLAGLALILPCAAAVGLLIWAGAATVLQRTLPARSAKENPKRML